MYHQRESGILFFLSLILPVDICYGILSMMKTAEIEDSRQEYMKDYQTITETGNFVNENETYSNESIESVIADYIIGRFYRKNNRPTIYRNIYESEKSRSNVGKIRRLSNGTSGRYREGSVTYEENHELAERTVSQIMLDRAIKDKYELKFYRYENYFYFSNRIGKTECINEYFINRDINETIHNNRINIEIKNIKNEYKNINEKNTKKYRKNIMRKIMKNNKPPRIEKAYMNRNFKNKCR